VFRFVDLVDIANLKAKALRREPQQGVQRVRVSARPQIQAHGKTAPGGFRAAS
jgi:hypothetical protein